MEIKFSKGMNSFYSEEKEMFLDLCDKCFDQYIITHKKKIKCHQCEIKIDHIVCDLYFEKKEEGT